jgi:predicted enzyme related to lactoylglutathione lyase
MSIQLNVVLYPVKDLGQAKAVFAALFGGEPHVDSPYYVGFSVNGVEIGLVPNGHEDQGMTGPVPFYDVEDIAATLSALQAAGARIVQEPTDVSAGLLVAKVRDADDNEIGVRQAPTNV